MATEQEYLDFLAVDPQNPTNHEAVTARIASGGDPSTLLPSAVDPGTVIEVASLGAFCWFQRPWLLSTPQGYLLGYVDTIQKSALIKTDGSAVVSQLGAATEKDDHNQACFHQRSDGRILALYSNHNGPSVYSRVSTPNIDAWASQVAIDMGEPKNTYPQPLKIDSQLFCFARRRNGILDQWVLAPITDGGSNTGSREGVWYGSGAATSDYRRKPYCVAASDGTQVDFFGTEGTGSASTTYTDRNRRLYHFRKGSAVAGWQKIDGSSLDDGIHNTARSSHGSADLIYEAAAGWASWVNHAQHGPDGHPWCLFQVTPAQDWNDHRLYLARWDGTQWHTGEIWAMGPTISPGESDAYSGNASFDSADPTKIYTTESINGVLEIVELKTTDNGATWTKSREITSGSTHNNQRPVGHNGNIAWFGGAAYTQYTQYQTKVFFRYAG